jgi:hypothetical protein
VGNVFEVVCHSRISSSFVELVLSIFQIMQHVWVWVQCITLDNKKDQEV